MGRGPKAKSKHPGGDATASLPTSSVASPPSLFTEEGLKQRLVLMMDRCDVGMATADSGSTEVKWAVEKRHLLAMAREVVLAEVQGREVAVTVAAAERLEKLLTGAGGAGGEDTDPPFIAPETPPPH